MVLFLMELSTRKVKIAGIAPSPNGLWMNQIGGNLTDVVDGILKGQRYLIHDRDPLFTTEFLQTLADCGVASVKLPPRSPNLKAYVSYCTSFRLCNGENRLLGPAASVAFENRALFQRLV